RGTALDQATTSERPRVRDKAKRQEDLLRAAVKVFARRGFEAATNQEIATEAGCSAGLIHAHFGGKRGLLLAVIESGILRTASIPRPAPPGQELEEDLEQMLVDYLDSMWKLRDITRVTIGQSAVDRELGTTLGRKSHARFFDSLATWLASSL